MVFELRHSPIGHRNHVRVAGTGKQTLVFAHGFGCDQTMWRHVAPSFVDRFRVVLFDHVGSGRSDIAAYDDDRYSTLTGYARDAVEVCADLDLSNAVFIGHSVSSMIGAEASVMAPERIGKLVMVGPSPCYLNDENYFGGFDRSDIDGLLETLEANYVAWARNMAPVIMGRPEKPELGNELADAFCLMDPSIAAKFARVTFLSDSRPILPLVKAQTLVLQCTDDTISPQSVGEYTHANLANSELLYLAAKGHCPNLSAPEETTAVIQDFLDRGERATIA